jgi:hypothetical protein
LCAVDRGFIRGGVMVCCRSWVYSRWCNGVL